MDLAFDVQRSVWLELLMCLLPPSGAALVIREVIFKFNFDIFSAITLSLFPPSFSLLMQYESCATIFHNCIYCV